MKYESFSVEYRLTASSIDSISEHIGDMLAAVKAERANVIRIRLSMEEALLRWRDRFGEDCVVSADIGIRHRRPTITLQLKGESYDPFENAENDLGEWSSTLLSGIGIAPRYTYMNGMNTVQLKLQRPRMNPALMFFISVAAGIFIGLLGEAVLPVGLRESILRAVLDPVQDAFYRLLNAAAGPVVFLTVLTAVCGIGSIAVMNRSGRRLAARLIFLGGLITLVCAPAAVLLFRPEYASVHMGGEEVSGVLDFFLQIIPSDILTPLIQGDSPQLILIAFIIGNALLAAGTQAGGLVGIIGQANVIGLMIADWVSRLTPYFVTLLLVLEIWNGSASMLVGIWKPVAVFAVFAVLMLAVCILRVSLKEKINASKLMLKMKDSFLTAFRSASVDAAYGENQICCEKRLGISHRLTAFGLPLGLVIYMPAGMIATMVFTLYAAQCTGVTVSAVWFVTAFFITVAVEIATPPMAGVDLLAYAVIFSRLGIPSGALAAAMVADVLFTFAVSAVNQAMLQLELLLAAGRTNQLDREILLK